MAGRNELPAVALGRPRSKGLRAGSLVEDRADVPHHRYRSTQWRLRTHAEKKLALRRDQLFSNFSDHRVDAVRLIHRPSVYESGHRAPRAGAGGKICRSRDRAWWIRLVALAHRTADRAAEMVRRGRLHRRVC